MTNRTTAAAMFEPQHGQTTPTYLGMATSGSRSTADQFELDQRGVKLSLSCAARSIGSVQNKATRVLNSPDKVFEVFPFVCSSRLDLNSNSFPDEIPCIN
jgi:hypothetical protein